MAQSLPDVPLLVLFDVIKIPFSVPVALMSNVIGEALVIDWLAGAGFTDGRVVDITRTTLDEQRSTEWMRFESLREALDPRDPLRTVEGHPAPVRAIVIAHKPGRSYPQPEMEYSP